jgi:hypothetical protein
VLYICPSLLFSTSQCKQFYVKFLIFGEKCLFPLLSMQRLLQFLMLQWLASLLKSDAQIRAQAFQANPSNNFHLVQNSLIRRLLVGPYRGNTKNLLKFLLHIIARTSNEQEWESKTECKEEDMGDKVEDSNTGDKVEGDLLDNHSSDPLAATEIVIHTNPYIRDCDFSDLAHTVLFMV